MFNLRWWYIHGNCTCCFKYVILKKHMEFSLYASNRKRFFAKFNVRLEGYCILHIKYNTVATIENGCCCFCYQPKQWRCYRNAKDGDEEYRKW